MPTLLPMHFVGIQIIAFVALLDTTVTHGPIIGDLTQDSVRVWVKTDEPGRVAVNSIKPDGTIHLHDVILTRVSKDNTHYVQITNLEPNTRYTYSVDGEFDDAADVPGWRARWSQ